MSAGSPTEGGAGMSGGSERKAVVDVACPCCGASLRVDAVLGTAEKIGDPVGAIKKEVDLGRAGELLAEESSRIAGKYDQIVSKEKERGAAAERLFKDFMEKAKDAPVEKPVRDIDLD